jgi:predicted DNA-binding transcriptional regulator AlpA
MTTDPTPPRLLTVQQVARHYGVKSRTVWRWEALGRIPRGLRFTRGTVRWRQDEIERHVAALVSQVLNPQAS